MSRHPRSRWDHPRSETNSNTYNGNWFPPVHVPPPQLNMPPPQLDCRPPLLDNPPPLYNNQPSLMGCPPPQPWVQGRHNQFLSSRWHPTDFHSDDPLSAHDFEIGSGHTFYHSVKMKQGSKTNDRSSRMREKDGTHDRNHTQDRSRSRDYDRNHGHVHDYDRDWAPHSQNWNPSGKGGAKMAPTREERSESKYQWHAKYNAYHEKDKDKSRYNKDTGPGIQNPGFTNGHRKDALPNQPPKSYDRFTDKVSTQSTDKHGRVHKRWNWDLDNAEDNDESNEINTWLMTSKDSEIHRNEVTKDKNKSPLPGSEEARNNAIRETTDRLKQALSKKKSTSVSIVNLLTATSKPETNVSKSNPYLLDVSKNLAHLELDASDMRAIGRANTGSVNCPLDEGDTNEEASSSEVNVVDLSESPSCRTNTDGDANTREVVLLNSPPSPSSRSIAEDKEIQRKDTNKRIANSKKSKHENDAMERQAASICSSPQRYERPLQVASAGDPCDSVTNMSSRTASSPSQVDVAPHSSTPTLSGMSTSMSCEVTNPVNAPFPMTDSNAFSPSSALIIKKLISKHGLQDLINSRSCKKVEFAMRELVKQHRATLSKEVRRVAESRIPSTPCSLVELPPDDSTLLADLTIDWQNLPSELISSLGDLFQNFTDVDDDPALITTASTSHSVKGITKLDGRNRSSTAEHETVLEWEQNGVGNDRALDLLKNFNSVPLNEEMNSKVSSSDETSSGYVEKSIERGMIQLASDSSPIGVNIEVGQKEKQSDTYPSISQNACEQMQNQNIDGSIISHHDAQSSDGTEDVKPIQFTEQAGDVTPAPWNHQMAENSTPPPPPFFPNSGSSVRDEILSPVLGFQKGNIRVRPFAREICMEETQKQSDENESPSARSEQVQQEEYRDNTSIDEMPLESSSARNKQASNCDSSVPSQEIIQKAVNKRKLELAQKERASLKSLGKKKKKKKQKRQLLVHLGERIWFQDKGNKKQKKKSTSPSENATQRRSEIVLGQETSPIQTSGKKKKPSKSPINPRSHKSLEKECVSVVGQNEPCSSRKSPTLSDQSLSKRLHSNKSNQICEENCESLERVSSTCETLNQSMEEICAMGGNSTSSNLEGNDSGSRFSYHDIEREPSACEEDQQSRVELPSLSGNSTDEAASQSFESEGVSILQLLRMTVPATTPQTCEMDESDIIRRLLEIDNELQTLVQEKLNLTHALKQKQVQKKGQQTTQDSSLKEQECSEIRSTESLRPNNTTISSKKRKENAPDTSRKEIPDVVDIGSDEDIFVVSESAEKADSNASQRKCEGAPDFRKKSGKKEKGTPKTVIDCSNNQTPNASSEEQSMNSSNKPGMKRKASDMLDCFVCVEPLSQSTVQSFMERPKNVAQSVSDVIKVPDAQNTIHNGSILDIKIYKKKLIAGAEDGNVYVYSLKTGKLRKTFTSSIFSNPSTITCMNVVDTGDSTLLFTGSNDGKLQCFNMETGEYIFKPVQVSNSIQCMEYNWKQVFMGTKTGCIVPFSLKSKTIKEPLTSGGSCVLSIQSTTEGPRRVLVVASRRQPITIRDAVSGLYLRTLNSNFSATVYSLLLHSSLVYCGTITQNISVFDFQSGALALELKAGNGVKCLKMLKGLLFAACYDNKLYIFDIKTKQFVTSLSFPGTMILSVAVTDFKMIVACKGALIELNYPDEVKALLLRDEDDDVIDSSAVAVSNSDSNTKISNKTLGKSTKKSCRARILGERL